MFCQAISATIHFDDIDRAMLNLSCLLTIAVMWLKMVAVNQSEKDVRVYISRLDNRYKFFSRRTMKIVCMMHEKFLSFQFHGLYDSVNRNFQTIRDEKEREILIKYTEGGKNLSIFYVCKSLLINIKVKKKKILNDSSKEQTCTHKKGTSKMYVLSIRHQTISSLAIHRIRNCCINFYSFE